MRFGAPLTGFGANAVAAETTLLPPFNSVPIDSFFTTAAASTAAVMKSDSGISCNLPIPRKRGRDHSIADRFASYSSPTHSQMNCGCDFYFLGEDISVQIQQQESDLDLLISQHMEKVRSEMAEKRRRNLEAMELGMARKLMRKEEEMERMLKLNCELEEQVKSLFVENQIWRDAAETNEATANALRINLEQAILHKSQVKTDHRDDGHGGGCDGAAESASSSPLCCGSNNYCDEGESDDEKMRKRRSSSSSSSSAACKNCWKEESCVLLLPCRHLCLCNGCGSFLQACPICNSANSATVRVIMP